MAPHARKRARKKKLCPAELAQAKAQEARAARVIQRRRHDFLLDQLCFLLMGIDGSRLDKLNMFDQLMLEIFGEVGL